MGRAAATEFPVFATKAGFTLVELLVALVILSTGLVCVMQVFQHAAVALRDARDTLRVAEIVRSEVGRVAVPDGPGDRGDAVLLLEGATDLAGSRAVETGEPVSASQGDRSARLERVHVIVRHMPDGRPLGEGGGYVLRWGKK